MGRERESDKKHKKGDRERRKWYQKRQGQLLKVWHEAVLSQQ